MRTYFIVALLYFALMDGFVFLLTGESLSHALIYKGPDARIGSRANLERQDRAEYENIERLKAKYAGETCDSDGTATAAANEDLPVPQDCQARAESIAQP